MSSLLDRAESKQPFRVPAKRREIVFRPLGHSSRRLVYRKDRASARQIEISIPMGRAQRNETAPDVHLEEESIASRQPRSLADPEFRRAQPRPVGSDRPGRCSRRTITGEDGQAAEKGQSDDQLGWKTKLRIVSAVPRPCPK
jgi:hypothetical protein